MFASTRSVAGLHHITRRVLAALLLRPTADRLALGRPERSLFLLSLFTSSPAVRTSFDALRPPRPTHRTWGGKKTASLLSSRKLTHWPADSRRRIPVSAERTVPARFSLAYSRFLSLFRSLGVANTPLLYPDSPLHGRCHSRKAATLARVGMLPATHTHVHASFAHARPTRQRAERVSRPPRRKNSTERFTECLSGFSLLPSTSTESCVGRDSTRASLFLILLLLSLFSLFFFFWSYNLWRSRASGLAQPALRRSSTPKSGGRGSNGNEITVTIVNKSNSHTTVY